MKTARQLSEELAEKNALLARKESSEKEREVSDGRYSYKWVEKLFAIPLITLICMAVFSALIYLVVKK